MSGPPQTGTQRMRAPRAALVQLLFHRAKAPGLSRREALALAELRPTCFENCVEEDEMQGDQLVVNAPNCVDCKATDVIGPRWQPREGGSGPNYRLM